MVREGKKSFDSVKILVRLIWYDWVNARHGYGKVSISCRLFQFTIFMLVFILCHVGWGYQTREWGEATEQSPI